MVPRSAGDERHLEVVAHAAVDATNVVAPGLTVVTRYTVTALGATTLRPGSIRIRAPAGRCSRAADQGVEVFRQARRVVGIGVPAAKSAAEVVDGVVAERRHRGDGGASSAAFRIWIDMGVQAVHAQPRPLDPGDGLPATAGASPNFEPAWPVA